MQFSLSPASPRPTWTVNVGGSFLLATFSIKRNGKRRREDVISNGRNSAAIIKTPINSRWGIGRRGNVNGIGPSSFRFSFVHYADYLIPSLPSSPTADLAPIVCRAGHNGANGKFSRLPPIPTFLCNFVQELSVVMMSGLVIFTGKNVFKYSTDISQDMPHLNWKHGGNYTIRVLLSFRIDISIGRRDMSVQTIMIYRPTIFQSLETRTFCRDRVCRLG